jgi:hypothetical protein
LRIVSFRELAESVVVVNDVVDVVAVVVSMDASAGASGCRGMDVLECPTTSFDDEFRGVESAA